MSYRIIADRVKSIMQRIDGVHNVHLYLRDVPDEAEFISTFTVQLETKTVLTAWMLTRTGLEVTHPTFDVTHMYDVKHRVEIQGFYGLSDAEESELEFQAVVDEILDKFRKKYLLEDEITGVALAGVILCDPIQVLEIGHGQFSNYFVHFTRLLLSVTERLQ